MLKKLFMVAAVLFGSVCANAQAVEQRDIRVFQEQDVTNVYQFDVSSEINELYYAKRQFNMERQYNPTLAYDHYYAKLNAIIEQLKNRRRAEYANVSFYVVRECEARAKAKPRPGAPHRYDEGDVWVHHPDVNRFDIIPGSGGWKELGSNRRNGGGAEIRSPRMNGPEVFAVHMWVKGPDWKKPDCFIKIDLYARCRYKDVVVDQLTQADMNILINRVKTGAGVN